MAKKIFSFAGIALLTLSSAFANAEPVGDAVAGKNKTSMCAGCHGIDGYRTAFPKVYSVPKLGGQHAGYIAAALRAYQTGARSSATMQGIAISLSEQDILDLSAYYADAAGRQHSAANK